MMENCTGSSQFLNPLFEQNNETPRQLKDGCDGFVQDFGDLCNDPDVSATQQLVNTLTGTIEKNMDFQEIVAVFL